ncbi:translocase of outer mitochondrial membrane, partial [Cymbomonas tetramitiformis]
VEWVDLATEILKWQDDRGVAVSMSEWERHAGSKHKKWRHSIRVVPSLPASTKHSDAMMTLGEWLQAHE